MSPASGDHLGDRLSALLDGELSPDAEVAARSHLAACAACAAELQAVEEARRLVRSLPLLDPPVSLWVWVRRRRRRARRAVVGLVASAAAAVALVLAATPRPTPVQPALADFVDAHAASASVAGDPVSELVPVGVSMGLGR